MPLFRDRNPAGHDLIRMVLDDETVEQLRAAAFERGIELEDLMGRLLTAAASRIDELVGEAEKVDPH
ncbi:MAG TPA: hypothetical protein VFA94_16845 [Acidimicrobiales bacterium]|nr:hypothetical protein [Acidimicrobiales bacterium]